MVDYHWRFRDLAHAQKLAGDGFEGILIDAEDKEFVRQNLLKVMAVTSEEMIL